MKAKLVKDEVKYIVVGSTMTKESEDGLEALMRPRGLTHKRELGMHCYIHKDGTCFRPVKYDERPAMLQHYSENSVFIMLEGGLDDAGEYSSTAYTDAQFKQLKTQLKYFGATYPHALVVLWRHLRSGVNPVFSLKDIGITET